MGASQRLTFALWDTVQRCRVLHSFPQRDSMGPEIRIQELLMAGLCYVTGIVGRGR